MATLLAKNADILATMDGARREIAGGGLFARDGVIEAVGPAADLPATADVTLDLAGCIVLPGLINTHHHFFQNLTRAVPACQDAALFGWLKTLYPIWARMGPEDVRLSAMVALAEMALTGCTCSSDHLYVFPNGARLDDEIAAAAEVGVRLHATRGAMSIGEEAGGLPPDSLCQPEDAILEDTLRVIQTFHDPKPGAMIRVGAAPCSPFSVSKDLMRQAALLARDQGVRLHTHLAENDEDVAYSIAHFGCRPGDYAAEVGWIGEDVWHAHCVKLDASEIDLFAKAGVSVAHCPCSNMRLGSGIAPVREMLGAGLNVALGVDGSASNDSGHLLNEARQAMLLQRVAHGGAGMGARTALELATRGGAKALGRDDLGSLEVGKRADFAVYDAAAPALSGAWDKLAGLLLCGPLSARHTVVEGRFVVRDGRLATLDLAPVRAAHDARAQALANGE